jgi:two-component system LytT family response regulator
MRAVIIDDERNARLAISGMLAAHFPEVEILGEANNLMDGIGIIRNEHPDVVFLDISMPGHSGLEIADLMQPEELDFAIIFFTAHDEFALQAFEMSAVDYLLKPVRLEALGRALRKVPEKRQMAFPFANAKLKKLALHTAEGTQFIKVGDILYLKADGSYTNFVLKDGRNIMISRGLHDFVKIEETGIFFRIHRSHLVNLNFINKYLKHDGGYVEMANGDQLSVAPQKKKDLLDRIQTFTY